MVAGAYGGPWVVVSNKAPFHIESVSPAWAQMFGMPEAAFLGRSLRVIEGPETDLRAVNRLMVSVTRCVEAHVSMVTYNVHGSQLWTHLFTAPLQSSAGTIDSFVVHTVSYDMMQLSKAMCAEEGPLLVMEISGQMVHVSTSLCQMLGVLCWPWHTTGAAWQQLLEDPDNRHVIGRLVAEVVHGNYSEQGVHGAGHVPCLKLLLPQGLVVRFPPRSAVILHHKMRFCYIMHTMFSILYSTCLCGAGSIAGGTLGCDCHDADPSNGGIASTAQAQATSVNPESPR